MNYIITVCLVPHYHYEKQQRSVQALSQLDGMSVFEASLDLTTLLPFLGFESILPQLSFVFDRQLNVCEAEELSNSEKLFLNTTEALGFEDFYFLI